MRTNSLSTWLLLAALPLASGCGSTGGAFRDRVPAASSAEQLGPIHISVGQTTRWQDIANDLEPRFTFNAQDIYNEDVPTTATAAERIIDVLQARFALNLAGTMIDRSRSATDNATSEISSENGGEPTSTQSRTRTRESSATESRRTPEAATLPELASATAPSAPGTRGTPSMTVDRVTRATNAAAVFQSLVLINRSVRDAVRRNGYEPYLVRLTFGVQPRRREQPFDLKIRVAFLPERTNGLESEADADPASSTQPDHLGPVLGGPWLSGEAPADSDAATRVDDFAQFRERMNALNEGSARLTGSFETALHYRFRIVVGPRVQNIQVTKACFFPFVAHYLTTADGRSRRGGTELRAAAARAYTLFSAAARFSAGFFEQFGPTARRPRCGVPDYVEIWQEMFDARRLRVPVVVPLIQTDNLEGTREQFAAEQLRQAALAISAIGGPVAGSAGFNRTMNRINDYEGTRLNSIYSISRLADNTIQVHIGAARLGRRYEMVTRNISATLLLLVPREQAGDTLQLVARPSFDNAETGETLHLTSEETRARGFQVRASITDDFCFARQGAVDAVACGQELTRMLRTYVGQSDWAGFTRAIADSARRGSLMICHPGPDFELDPACPQELFVELQREGQRLRPMARDRVPLEPVQARNLPPNQTATARLESGNYTVRLVGIDPWLIPSLRAALTRDCRQGTQRGGTGPSVMASSLSMDGNVGRFVFTNAEGLQPRQLCLWIDNATFTPAALALVNGFSAGNPQAYPIALVAAEAPARPAAAAAAPFRLASNTQRIALNAGQGVAHLVVSNFDRSKIDRVRLSSDGAILQASDPAQSLGDLFAVTVARNARLSLTIGGLRAGVPARIRAQGLRGDAEVGPEAVLEIDTGS